jgi:hypothetical protein
MDAHGVCPYLRSADADENPVLFARSSPYCALAEVLTPKQLGNSERGAFTADGRFFAIGLRPEPEGDGLYWLVEVTRSGTGYTSTNVLTGTLEGTSDGTLGGQPKGDACGFSGMTVQGDVLYAGCFATDGRASLVQIDTATEEVRAGAFTTCNFEPGAQPCKPISIYPNGMAIDHEGRIYTSNTQAYGIAGPAVTDYSIAQIEIDPEQPDPGQLKFTFRSWLTKNVFNDSVAPNGIQIRDDVLYYVGGANVNAVPILADGKAGPLRVLFSGPAISLIDDFALGDGELLIARALPANIGRLRWPTGAKTAREITTCPMPALGAASSLTYQPTVDSGEGLFPAGTIVVTSFFGGGLYTLPGFR